jgi:hypothetical protein
LIYETYKYVPFILGMAFEKERKFVMLSETTNFDRPRDRQARRRRVYHKADKAGIYLPGSIRHRCGITAKQLTIYDLTSLLSYQALSLRKAILRLNSFCAEKRRGTIRRVQP